MKHSLSVIVPAFNEEKNLEIAVAHAIKVVGKLMDDYEIIIINDGSKDNTAKIAEKLSRKNKRIRVYHNQLNSGVGYTYMKGVRLAKKEYVLMVPGDDETDIKSLASLLGHLGEADIIIPYITNKQNRPWYRVLVSGSFVNLMNFLFRLNIRYYTGSVINKTRIVKKIRHLSNRFALMPELIVLIVKSGYSYKQIPMEIGKRRSGRTSIFKLNNVISVFVTLMKLMHRVYVSQNMISNSGGQ